MRYKLIDIVTISVIVYGGWIVIGFTEFSQLVTTSKNYALTVLHDSQTTIGHTRCSQSVTIFNSDCSVTASDGGRSSFSGFPSHPRPPLPASHSIISKQLNPQLLSTKLTNQINQLILLTCPTCSISARTAQETPFFCYCLWQLPSNDRRIVAYFAVVTTCHNM
jgi:hypothetical protein